MKAKNIYSKSSSFYLDSKKDFFNENQKLLERAEDQNKLYSSQPNRLNCKICKSNYPAKSILLPMELIIASVLIASI